MCKSLVTHILIRKNSGSDDNDVVEMRKEVAKHIPRRVNKSLNPDPFIASFQKSEK